MWEKLLLGIVCTAAGAFFNEVFHRLRDRTVLIGTVADRYLAEAHGGPDTPAFRLGIMQRAGVAMLTPAQVKRFCREVTARGGIDPFHGSDILTLVPLKKFPLFLRAASARGIPLADDFALYGFLIDLVQKKAGSNGRQPAQDADKN